MIKLSPSINMWRHREKIGRTFRKLSSFDLVNDRFKWKHADVPLEMSRTPPSSWYVDKWFLDEVEKSHTFRNWLFYGRNETVKEALTFHARNLIGEPLAILNNGSDKLSAFYNVCRHHAAQILEDGVGLVHRSKHLRCPYHGWEYNAADGRLVKAVKMQGCQNFKPKEMGLFQLEIDTVGPWLFVNLGQHKTGKLTTDQSDIAEMVGMLQETGFEKLKFVHQKSYHIKCNWKVFIDNYLDGGYHVPIAHPGLASELDMKKYKRKGYPSFYLQSCGGKVNSPPTKETGEGKETSRGAQVNGRVINADQSYDALYIFHYPNLCINRYGKWMDINVVWPEGPDACRVDFEWYAEVRRLAIVLQYCANWHLLYR
jgi:choline monooxygenase